MTGLSFPVFLFVVVVVLCVLTHIYIYLQHTSRMARVWPSDIVRLHHGVFRVAWRLFAIVLRKPKRPGQMGTEDNASRGIRENQEKRRQGDYLNERSGDDSGALTRQVHTRRRNQKTRTKEREGRSQTNEPLTNRLSSSSSRTTFHARGP